MSRTFAAQLRVNGVLDGLVGPLLLWSTRSGGGNLQKEDHLSNEVSIGVEVTPTGVEAKAKSPLLSSIDRLAGSFFDRWSASNERSAERERALGESEKKLIKAATVKVAEHIGASDVAAAGVLKHQIEISFSRQRNVEDVVQEAIEDLRRTPPSEEQNKSGPEEVSRPVIDRLGRYAEDASTGELQQRWGRVMATEIRAPGTVTNKVMRIVDEMDAINAALFERFCGLRLGNIVPRALQVLTFQEKADLVHAGLIMDDTGGLILSFDKMDREVGGATWRLPLEYAIVYVPDLPDLARLVKDVEWLQKFDELTFGVHILTPEGMAVASILPSNPAQVVGALDKVLKEVHPNAGAVRRR